VAAIPDGLWIQCSGCRELLFTRELERNLKVCKKCNHHFRLTAYTVTPASEPRRLAILCPYALGFGARPLRAIL